MDLILFAVSSLVLIREHISHAVIGGLTRFHARRLEFRLVRWPVKHFNSIDMRRNIGRIAATYPVPYGARVDAR